LLGIIFPIAGVLPSKFVLGIGYPVGALAVSLVLGPASLVLISICVVLYAEAVFLVVFPISDVFVGAAPLVGFGRSVFVEGLFLCGSRGTLTQ
jgi:hypothetical protein